jgi:hypothetical protein
MCKKTFREDVLTHVINLVVVSMVNVFFIGKEPCDWRKQMMYLMKSSEFLDSEKYAEVSDGFWRWRRQVSSKRRYILINIYCIKF